MRARAAHAPAVAAAAFARSPPRLRASLGWAVLMHRLLGSAALVVPGSGRFATRRNRAFWCATMRIHAPMRAVVIPPHLHAKTHGFYALMRPALAAAWRGPRSDRRLDSSMHFCAPWLCRLAIILVTQRSHSLGTGPGNVYLGRIWSRIAFTTAASSAGRLV